MFSEVVMGTGRNGTWDTADAPYALVAVDVADKPIPRFSVPATIR